MNSGSNRFRFAKDQTLSWRFLSRQAGLDRLRGIANSGSSYRFFWARNAIYHGLRALGVSPGDRVLVPSYVCAAAIEPIAAYGAEPVFYAVRRDCSLDMRDVESKIDHRTKALLAVHYFGFPQSIAACRELCDRYSLFLIEDCAHVLQSDVDGQPLGSFGDASVFSWRKFLPLYDGGELVLKDTHAAFNVDWRDEGIMFTLKAAKTLLDQMAEGTHNPAMLTLAAFLEMSKGLLRPAGRNPRTDAPALTVESNTVSFVPEMVNFPMSRLSQAILRHSDTTAVIAARRNNYLYLENKLSDIHGIQLLFSGLPEGVCPWVLPVFFEDLANAHLPLRALGVPAVTWGGVRHPCISGADFPDADFLYENLVFLPIHQGLRQAELDFLAKAVHSVREKNQTFAHAVRS